MLFPHMGHHGYPGTILLIAAFHNAHLIFFEAFLFLAIANPFFLLLA